MRRLKHNFKKGMAFVLTFAMIAGLVPAMSGGANKGQAASGSGTEPSVSAYATKTQLMDNTFAPNADGTAENYGMIVFGNEVYNNGLWNLSGLLWVAYGAIGFGVLYHILFSCFSKNKVKHQ